MAVSENYLQRNPAKLLFIPREAPRPDVPSMDFEQVKLLFSVPSGTGHRWIGDHAGMRPGEIFRFEAGGPGGRLRRYHAAGVPRRVRYSQDVQLCSLGGCGQRAFILDQGWLEMLPGCDPDAWVFPSESGKTPLWKDNCWRRHVKPKIQKVGLGCVNFQVLRKTHSCLLADLGVGPQVRADQMGHTVDVNQNRYTKSSLGRRQEAVNSLEQALGVM